MRVRNSDLAWFMLIRAQVRTEPLQEGEVDTRIFGVYALNGRKVER